jgi:hypothetical protein
MTTASDYLTNADTALNRSDPFREPERAQAYVAEAQVSAIQAVAAAIDRLAEAVENLQR